VAAVPSRTTESLYVQVRGGFHEAVVPAGHSPSHPVQPRFQDFRGHSDDKFERRVDSRTASWVRRGSNAGEHPYCARFGVSSLRHVGVVITCHHLVITIPAGGVARRARVSPTGGTSRRAPFAPAMSSLVIAPRPHAPNRIRAFRLGACVRTTIRLPISVPCLRPRRLIPWRDVDDRRLEERGASLGRGHRCGGSGPDRVR
jgi:hypothetical protein